VTSLPQVDLTAAACAACVPLAALGVALRPVLLGEGCCV